MLETPIYGYGDACILDANAMFHIGVLLMNETQSHKAPSPPAAISQPKIHANALRTRPQLGKPTLTAIPPDLCWILEVRERGLGMEIQEKGREAGERGEERR